MSIMQKIILFRHKIQVKNNQYKDKIKFNLQDEQYLYLFGFVTKSRLIKI